MRKPILLIALLVVIDQCIKLVIYHHFMDARFDILSPLLEFHPKFNSKGNYWNGLLNLNIGINFFIVFVLVMQCVAIHLFLYMRRKTTRTSLLNLVFVFFEAGYLCAMCGYIFWSKGCLDYIYLKPLFIFDLKDVYLNVFACLFCVYGIKIEKDKRKQND